MSETGPTKKQGCRILIVDDNQQNRYMLETLLTDEGIEVVSAKNGNEALAILKKNGISGIISDILMPGMDGFQLIRECKKDPVLRTIPFIFYTATYTEKRDEEFGLSLGALRYIVKPAEPYVLVSQIKEAFLEHARSPRDYHIMPVPDEETFAREYAIRVGAKLVKKERALAESEEKFRLVVQSAPDAIFIQIDKKFSYVNPAAVRLFGAATESDLIGTPVLTRFHPDFHAQILLRIRSLNEEKKPVNLVEEDCLKIDGTRFHAEVSAVPFIVQGKNGALVFLRDITARKIAEAALCESEEKYRLLNQNSMGAILLTSPDGGILSANPAACAMFGRSEEEIISGGRNGLVDMTDPNLPLALEERARTGRFVGELTFLRKDGSRFSGEVSSSIFTDRLGHTRSSMIIRDISERKKQEKALRVANQKLNLMNIVAWHDIYNKVTGLRGYVQLSRDHITDQKAREFLHREEEILKVLQQQILYTKEYQEMGQKPPGWYPLDTLIKNVQHSGIVGPVQIINEAKNLELYADPVIEKVFWHLVDNSIKHGETVTEICITANETGSGCTLIYRDNGVGIPEEKRGGLFTKSFGKMTGFDLFFVHDILDISGMTIRETGEQGKGARFEIGIPRGLCRFSKK